MSYQLTKKQVKENSPYLMAVGYCGMQHLLNFKSRFGYSSGVYGWSCDYYDVNGVTISTGYAPIGTHFNDYEVLKSYEQKAEAIQYNYNLSYEERKNQIEALLLEVTGLFKKQQQKH